VQVEEFDLIVRVTTPVEPGRRAVGEGARVDDQRAGHTLEPAPFSGSAADAERGMVTVDQFPGEGVPSGPPSAPGGGLGNRSTRRGCFTVHNLRR